MKEWMTECPECGTPVKNYRGFSAHIAQGCQAAILDLHIEGETVSSLARRFKKTPVRINTLLRLEKARRKVKGHDGS